MRKERVVIFVMVGLIMFSAVATGLLLLAAQNNNSRLAESQNRAQDSAQTCQASVNQGTLDKLPQDWPPKFESPVDSLQIIDLVEGAGRAAALGNCITVNYRLALADGTLVDNNDTFTAGTPIAFELVEGGLIDGWIQGIPGLKEGGLRRLVVPASLGYGDVERPGIPAGSTLVFDVELVKIEY